MSRRKVYQGGLYRFEPAGKDIFGRPVYAAYCMGRFEGHRYRLVERELVTWVPCPDRRMAGRRKRMGEKGRG